MELTIHTLAWGLLWASWLGVEPPIPCHDAHIEISIGASDGHDEEVEVWVTIPGTRANLECAHQLITKRPWHGPGSIERNERMSTPETPAEMPAPQTVDPNQSLGQASFKTGGFRGKVEDGELVDLILHDVKLETKPNKFKNGEMQTRVVWDFAVKGQDPEEYGCLRWWTSFSMHKKSKLPGTLVALVIPAPTEESPALPSVTEILKTAKPCRGFVELEAKEGFDEPLAVLKSLKPKK